jgi:hypothetical protein
MGKRFVPLGSPAVSPLDSRLADDPSAPFGALYHARYVPILSSFYLPSRVLRMNAVISASFYVQGFAVSVAFLTRFLKENQKTTKIVGVPSPFVALEWGSMNVIV